MQYNIGEILTNELYCYTLKLTPPTVVQVTKKRFMSTKSHHSAGDILPHTSFKTSAMSSSRKGNAGLKHFATRQSYQTKMPGLSFDVDINASSAFSGDARDPLKFSSTPQEKLKNRVHTVR